MHLYDGELSARIGASTLYLIYAREPFEAIEREITAEREEKPELWEVFDSLHHALDEMRIKRLKELVGVGYKLSLHSPFEPWINIADREPSRRKQAIMRMKDSIDAAAELEAVFFTLHPGVYSGLIEDKRKMSLLNADAIVSLYDYADSRGIVLSVENMPPNRDYFLVTPQEFLDIKEQSGLKLKITFDAGHANLAGLIDEFLKTLVEYIFEVHVHDNRGGLDEHLEVGLGSIDWPKIVKELYIRDKLVYYVAETYKPPFKSVAWLKEKTSAFERRFRFTRGI